MLIATYATKKMLKESIGKALDYVETSMFGSQYQMNGTFAVVGPTAHKRKWFATVTMREGQIDKVK